MQWLIDLIIETIGIPPTFIHRGDPDAIDFVTGDFTTDGNWNELDLSSIVPENAKGVALALRIKAPAVNRAASFRRSGQTHPWNSSRSTTQVADLVYTGDITVAVDTNRKIEYNFPDVAWDLINLTVKNWWL